MPPMRAINFAAGRLSNINVEESQSDTHGGDGFDQRAHCFHRTQNAHRIGKLRLVAAAEVPFLLLLAPEGFDDANPGEALLHRHDHLGHAQLLIVDRLARSLAIHAERHQAAREKHQRDDGKFPVHVKEHADPADDRDWLLEKIAADAGERGLHQPGVVCDLRHEKAGLDFVKEIHRLANHLAEELGPDVGQHLVADPVHVIGVGVATEAAQGHDRWDREAEQDEGIDLRAVVHHLGMLNHLLRGHWGLAVEHGPGNARHNQREERIDNPVEKTKAEADNEAPFIRQGIAIESLVWTAILCEWWSRAVP